MIMFFFYLQLLFVSGQYVSLKSAWQVTRSCVWFFYEQDMEIPRLADYWVARRKNDFKRSYILMN